MTREISTELMEVLFRIVEKNPAAIILFEDELDSYDDLSDPNLYIVKIREEK